MTSKLNIILKKLKNIAKYCKIIMIHLKILFIYFILDYHTNIILIIL